MFRLGFIGASGTLALMLISAFILSCGASEPSPTVTSLPTSIPTATLLPISTPTTALPAPTSTPAPQTTSPFTEPVPSNSELTEAKICETASDPPVPPTGTVDFSGLDYFTLLETDKGDIRIRLFDDRAPNTTENFINLACIGFYDGIVFHRVIPDFVVQGGDPMGTGIGGPGYRFADQFHPDLNHSVKGAMSMANSGVDTNGSQFFITLAPQPHLDAYSPNGSIKDCSQRRVSCHAVFGYVYEGFENVERIEIGDTIRKATIYSVESSE